MTRPSIAAIVIAFSLLSSFGATARSQTGEELSPAEKLAIRRTPIVDVFNRNQTAVVNIAATMEVTNYRGAFPRDLFDDFLGPQMMIPKTYQYTSIGSGFVIHPDGYVVTNAHVVMRAAGQKVIFSDSREFEAERVAVDEKHDLAILKIQADEQFPSIDLGRSHDLMIGETVVAIGNPLGYQHTVTSGIISALDRTLRFSQGGEYTGLIQTDASINRGNSGGPLLNILGELIGINTAIRGDAQNIGFAIPVDTLRKLLPDMLDIEHRKRLEVGLRLSWRDSVYVVEATGPAAEANIEPGDQLVSVDSIDVDQDIDFYIYLLKAEVDKPMKLTLNRNGKTVHTSLVPRSIPAPDGQKLLRSRAGINARMLTEREARRIHRELRSGLLITGIEYGSPAHKAGFQRGHIIIQIGNRVPTDMEEVGIILERLEEGTPVRMTVLEVRRRELSILQGELTLR